MLRQVLYSFIAVILIVISTNHFSNAQIVINEVCTSNSVINQDEDGDYPDWVELYNSGATAVNLYKYSISDDIAVPQKWVFPGITIPPNSHLLMFASDKDRKAAVHHWENVIKDDDFWRYQVPTSEPSATWRTPAFDDSGWSLGKGGFGYGDGDDSTIITFPSNSVYFRKTFNVIDKTKIAQAVLHMDYDDGYVAYLNGVPIGRKNMPGGFPSYNTDATAGREATMYSGGLPEAKLVNYDTLLMALVNGTNVLCIQVHNNNIGSSDLTARAFLSFGIGDASVLFNPTPAWFNISASLPLHTNFKLADGETLYLIDSLGVTQDSKLLIPTKPDHSYGRKPDGNSAWQVFTVPTPGSTNNSSTSYASYCSDPLTFYLNAGFYTANQTVSISGSTTIRYTLDGSEPTPSSALYSGPILINATKVLRAGCFTGSTIPYQTYTKTYFINSPSTLPVFSISTTPSNLFDPITGIYMLGPNADSANYPYFGANFWEDWERPVHVEFFEKDKTLKLEQDADMRIYGNWSRGADQKSIALKAKQKYGSNSFDYRFFPSKYISSFSQIVLRNSGSDNNNMQYRDGFVQKSVSKKTSLDIQDYRPAAVYINGQYWGILNIREKINAEYIEKNHNISKDKVDLAESWGQELSGTNNIYALQWIAKNYNMADPNLYKYVADSFDLDNMVDYFATEIFISNWDWPQNNLKFWRPSEGNRKWRYILWDTDISMGIWGIQPANFNQLGRIKNAAPLTIGPHADIFNELLKNTAYRNKFVNRYADMMNTMFQATNLRKLMLDMRDSISAEIPKHKARWAPWMDWDGEIQNTDNFFTTRIGFARNEIRSEFSLVKQVNVTLAVSPAGAGYIKINSIYPETYPWTGVYFDGVPVQITAVPNPGYTFNYWQSNNLITSPNYSKSVSINVTSSAETFTAYFTGSPAPISLTVSEINYNSVVTADAGDWLELHNYGSTSADISGWKLKDYYKEYIFPNNTIIPAGGYLVLCSDTAKFKSQFPTVTNYIGPIGMSLSNSGDLISIYNHIDNVYLSFEFKDLPPWPFGPDGLGYTLESMGNTVNPALASSWFSGCLGGSPAHPYSPLCILETDEVQHDQKLVQVFPNPAKNNITIEVGDGASFNEWKLINNQGVELMRKEIIGNGYSEKIDLSGTTPGLYTVVFNGEKSRLTKKIIIQ